MAAAAASVARDLPEPRPIPIKAVPASPNKYIVENIYMYLRYTMYLHYIYI